MSLSDDSVTNSFEITSGFTSETILVFVAQENRNNTKTVRSDVLYFIITVG